MARVLFCTVATNPLGPLDARIVVDAGGVNLQHLPPEHLLGRTDVADAREQLVEVAAPAAPLQAVVDLSHRRCRQGSRQGIRQCCSVTAPFGSTWMWTV